MTVQAVSEDHGGQVGQRAAKGAMLLIGSRLVSRLFDFAALLVLARLLTPPDFGLVAIAMSLMQVIEAVFELPVAQVVVRAQEPDRAMLDTAFTLSLIRGLALAVVMALIAWPAALFFRQPGLAALILVLSLSPFMRGMLSPGLAFYSRALNFHQDVAIELAGKFAALIVAVIAALVLRNYWAIVAGTVTGPLVMMIVSYLIAPMVPRLSLARWREFMGILGWVSASQIISALNWQFDRLILSRFVSPASLGAFSMASDLANLPNQIILVPLWRPLMSAFSVINRKGEAPRDKVLATCAILIALLLPVCILASLLARPLVIMVLGQKWAVSADYLQYLVVLIIPVFVTPVTSALLMAKGRTRLTWWINFAEMVIKLPAALILILRFGLYGAIMARALAVVLVFAITVVVLGRVARLSRADLWRQAWRPLAAAMALAAVVMVLRARFGQAGQGALWGAPWQVMAIATGAVGLLAYGIVLLALDFAPLRKALRRMERLA